MKSWKVVESKKMWTKKNNRTISHAGGPQVLDKEYKKMSNIF